jgi:cell division protease FtsH
MPVEHVAFKPLPVSPAQAPPLAEKLCDPETKVTYSDFLAAIKQGRVESVLLPRDMHIGKVKLRCAGGTEREATLVLPENYDILSFLLTQNVDVDFVGSGGGEQGDSLGKWFMVALQVLGQVAFVGLVLSMVMSARNGGSTSPFMGITSARAKLFESNEIDTRFSDVAGADNAKRDLEEVVDFLKNPDKYSKVGARIPKGVLLSGPPGCGKTLLARSVAGEAGVPFFSTTGSSMVELFVGVAAARIRDMFKKAKEKSPCIIFIDEIDAIGKARSMSLAGGGSEERDQALNQLLTEMDGFDVNHGVIVIAATNRPDILDEALLRPGRFDRCVSVDMPDLRGREGILKVHAAGLPLGESVNLAKLARNTVGFTGADLMNLCNEAAIYAARASNEQVCDTHFDMALEKAFEIREEIFAKYPLTCMHIYHSLGEIKVGEICLFVFTSSKHRKAAMQACDELVERVKAELPIWGKEILDAGAPVWKVNT